MYLAICFHLLSTNYSKFFSQNCPPWFQVPASPWWAPSTPQQAVIAVCCPNNIPTPCQFLDSHLQHLCCFLHDSNISVEFATCWVDICSIFAVQSGLPIIDPLFTTTHIINVRGEKDLFISGHPCKALEFQASLLENCNIISRCGIIYLHHIFQNLVDLLIAYASSLNNREAMRNMLD